MERHCALNQKDVVRLLTLTDDAPVEITIGNPIQKLKLVTIRYEEKDGEFIENILEQILED